MNLVNCLALLLVWHAHSVSKLPVPVVMSLSSSGVRVSYVFIKDWISINMGFRVKSPIISYASFI